MACLLSVASSKKKKSYRNAQYTMCHERLHAPSCFRPTRMPCEDSIRRIEKILPRFVAVQSHGSRQVPFVWNTKPKRAHESKTTPNPRPQCFGLLVEPSPRDRLPYLPHLSQCSCLRCIVVRSCGPASLEKNTTTTCSPKAHSCFDCLQFNTAVATKYPRTKQLPLQ